MGHSVERRVLVCRPLSLGNRVTMGSMAVAMAGSRLDDGCTVGALSLVMKGEYVPPGSGERSNRAGAVGRLAGWLCRGGSAALCC